MRILKPLSLFVFFFALACEKIFVRTRSIENRCYRTGKYPVRRRVLAFFSPKILQAGAVMGLECCVLQCCVGTILCHDWLLPLRRFCPPRNNGDKSSKDGMCLSMWRGYTKTHTPRIAFRHLPAEGCLRPVLGV